MSPIEKSSKLENVCYDIRGPVLKEAKRLEEEGNKVLKLNIGNPAFQVDGKFDNSRYNGILNQMGMTA
ncbi:hypothetical protein ACUOFC_41205, partial [Escherichia sp. TWPC-MK]